MQTPGRGILTQAFLPCLPLNPIQMTHRSSESPIYKDPENEIAKRGDGARRAFEAVVLMSVLGV